MKDDLIWNGKADGAIGGGISFAVVGGHDSTISDMTNIVIVSKETEDEENVQSALAIGSLQRG